jgi:anti-sigma regulatory factor (Ser/Thr protein kinase)
MPSLELNPTSGADNGMVTAAGPSRFLCRLFADPAHLRPARQAIVHWARDIGLGPEIVEDLALAVGEALSNSIEHGYRVVDGHIEVDGRCTERELRVAVIDHGQWRTPTSRAGSRGRGISMIHALADEARVEQWETGTTVTMIWRLWR